MNFTTTFPSPVPTNPTQAKDTTVSFAHLTNQPLRKPSFPYGRDVIKTAMA